nr:hypothetical protein [Chelatococcus asaccharovorans]
MHVDEGKRRDRGEVAIRPDMIACAEGKEIFREDQAVRAGAACRNDRLYQEVARNEIIGVGREDEFGLRARNAVVARQTERAVVDLQDVDAAVAAEIMPRQNRARRIVAAIKHSNEFNGEAVGARYVERCVQGQERTLEEDRFTMDIQDD